VYVEIYQTSQIDFLAKVALLHFNW